MQIAQIVPPRESWKYGSSGEPGIQPPMTVAANVAAAPISEASTTRPLRMRYMYSPTNSAIGIVQAIVNVPQELPGTCCLTPPPSTSHSRPNVRSSGLRHPRIACVRNVVEYQCASPVIVNGSLRTTSPPFG